MFWAGQCARIRLKVNIRNGFGYRILICRGSVICLFSQSKNHSSLAPTSTTLPRKSYRVLFLGSDDFSIQSFNAVTVVFPTPSQIQVIVSNPYNSLAKYVKTLQPQHDGITLGLWDEFKSSQIGRKESFEFDLGVVSSFGHLLPAKIIDQCKMGILNVHGSLLPRWRGAAPAAAAIINGDDVTGVSIMKIAAYRFDIGPILYQVKVDIDPHIRAPELTSILAKVGSEALQEVLANLDKYYQIALPQAESQSTKAPKLSPSISYIQWESMNAVEIYNLFRGTYGRLKLKTEFHGRVVDLDEIAVVNNSETDENSPYLSYYGCGTTKMISLQKLPSHANPGDVLYADNVLYVKCESSSDDLRRNWVCIRKVKINQKWMTPADFKNGWLSKVPEQQRRFKSIHLENITSAKTTSKT